MVVASVQPSEGKASLLGVAHTLQVWQTGKLDHGWRSTHQYQRLLPGRWEVVPDHLLIHEALAVVPVCRREQLRQDGIPVCLSSPRCYSFLNPPAADSLPPKHKAFPLALAHSTIWNPAHGPHNYLGLFSAVLEWSWAHAC